MLVVINLPNPKFPIGEIVVDPKAATAILESGQDLAFFLGRHCRGDYGYVDTEEKEINEIAIECQGQVVSAYKTLSGKDLWFLSEGFGSNRKTYITTEKL